MNKKILFLTAWYPTRYDPMTGLFVKRHAELLSEHYDVSVLHALAVDSPVKSYEIEVSTENNVHTIRVFYKKVSHHIPVVHLLQKLWRLFKAQSLGYKSMLKHHSPPQLVHVNILTRVGLFALYLKARYRIPYVITEHWSRYLPERKEYKGILRKLATKTIVHSGSGISTVTEKLKNAMNTNGISHERFIIVRNVVDTTLFKPIKPKPNDSNVLVFSHISCFDNDAKNTNGIVRAVAALSKHRNDFLCLMVGDGPDKREAERLAEQLGINADTIRFVGLLEGSDIVDVYNQSLFIVLFSNYETMSVVISESYACGKPVLATNVGGIPEIVNDELGLLIPPKNEEGLTTAINYMLDNYANFDPVKIRNFSIEQFGKNAVFQQFEALYQTIFTNDKQ